MDNGWQIGLIDNEKVFREYFSENLNKVPTIEKIHFWTSAEEFLHDRFSIQLDILFVDIILPHMSGLDLIQNIDLEEVPYKIVVITSVNSDENILCALKAGAAGYIHKAEIFKLDEVIDTIMNGGAVLTPAIALKVIRSFQTKKENRKEYRALTNREKQILELLVKGHSVKEVGTTLLISIFTVRNHIKKIYKKLNVNSRTEMVLKVHKFGFY